MQCTSHRLAGDALRHLLVVWQQPKASINPASIFISLLVPSRRSPTVVVSSSFYPSNIIDATTGHKMILGRGLQCFHDGTDRSLLARSRSSSPLCSVRIKSNPSKSQLLFLSSSSFMAESNDPEVADQPEDSYSVWALPPSDLKVRLKSLMSSLRSEFGGPAFDPHITVVGDLRLRRDDAIARFHSAAAALEPYTVRIAAVAYGTFFYQCVYLLIDPYPEVVEASSHCCGHFGYKRSTPYMPHVSLIYGDLSDEEKQNARNRVEEIDESICGLTFEVSLLALCKTDTLDKTTESWEVVELCDLKKKDLA